MPPRPLAFALPAVGLIAALGLSGPTGAGAGIGGVASACPIVGAIQQTGTLGGAVDDPVRAPIGISGLAVSRFDSEVTGEQIAWAVGDRFANELAGTDEIFLFGLDARDGSLAVRYPLDPAGFQDDPVEPTPDTITTLGQTANPIPDFEELSLVPAAGAPGRLWLFDTGDNGGARGTLNAYAVAEPDLATEPAAASGAPSPLPSPSSSPQLGPSYLTSHPELDEAITGRTLPVMRYPIRLMQDGAQVATNVEAAFVDANAPDPGPAPIYLIEKSAVDADGDGARTEFRVFRTATRNTAASGLVNDAVYVGTISFGQGDLKVTAASILDDGSAFVVRAVNGGGLRPDLDVVGLWWRGAGSTIEDEIAARPTPECRWSLNSAPDSSSEETIAFDLTDAASTGFDGFVWTHDVRGAAAPFFRASRTG